MAHWSHLNKRFLLQKLLICFLFFLMSLPNYDIKHYFKLMSNSNCRTEIESYTALAGKFCEGLIFKEDVTVSIVIIMIMLKPYK